MSSWDRVWLVVAVSAAVAISTVSIARVLRAPRAVASARFSGDQPASALVDGNVEREWLLPDATAGWADLYLSPYRTVDSLRVVNAINAPWRDREARALKVEVFFDDDLRQTHTAAFEDGGARALEIPIGVRADRIRLSVDSWKGLGGGLAEVELR